MLIGLTILYFVLASITVFDKRFFQAKKSGVLPEDEFEPPRWVAVLYWIEITTIIAIAVINWRYGILLFVIKFVLSVLPVLEIIGNILMRPFRPKDKNNI